MSGADPEKVEIRPLALEDIGEAMRLKSAAGWNQTGSDWDRLLKLEPGGCFAATVCGMVVGTTTTTTYGRGLAWVGMVLVSRDFRRRGIATKLVRAALGWLSESGVSAVKLDATPEGAHVYEGLGFEAESRIERWSGVARPSAVADRSVGEVSDPSTLFALDRRVFGADRSPLLSALCADAAVSPLASVTPGGSVRGYVLTRSGSEAFYVGPLVAEDVGVAASLLDGALGNLAGRRVFVDLNTTFEGGAEELASRGFVRQRVLIRMRYGGRSAAVTSPSVFAIAGPEYG